MGYLVNTQMVPQIPPDGEKKLPPVGSKKWLNSQNPTILYPVLTCSVEKGSLVPSGLLHGQAVRVSGESKVGREPGGASCHQLASGTRGQVSSLQPQFLGFMSC